MADEMFQLKVDGLEELIRKFETMDNRIDEFLEKATAAGSAVIVREAAINARKGGDNFPNRITGNLIRSITMISKKTSNHRCEIAVGSAMDYACRLEYGFSEKDKLGRQYHQRPRPFMRTALDAHKEEVQEEFNQIIEDLTGLLK
jgi:HK97 gp10 family phage protein